MLSKMSKGFAFAVCAQALLGLTIAVAAQGEFAEPERVADVIEGRSAVANASWWGFDEEDSTRFVQAALDSPAPRVVIPNMGKPWVVEPLSVNRDDVEVFFEQGAVVEAKRGAFRGRNDSLLTVWDRKNIVLSGYGAVLRMHKQDYWNEPYRRAEWRHALDIRGCTNVKILGLTLSNSGGDGIYLSSTANLPHVKDVVVRDVVCDGNNRQGMSVISAENLLVENSVFSNTIGTAPMAGIDLEPNRAWQSMVNVVIRNCLFLDNSQLGMHVWLSNLNAESRPVSILWENNYVKGGEIGIHVSRTNDEGPSGYVRFRNNIVEDTQFAGIYLREVSAQGGLSIEFEGNVLRNTARRGEYREDEVEFYRQYTSLDHPAQWWGNTGSPSAPVVLTAQRGSRQWQGNVRFKNDLVIHDRDEPAVVIGGVWPRYVKEMFGAEAQPAEDAFQGWANVSGIIRVINPLGTLLDKQTPVRDFALQVNP